MSDKTGIEWTDATWNPIRGCSRVSEGCKHCYAEDQAARIIAMDRGRGIPEGQGAYDGLLAKGGQWNGKIKVVESVMDQPLRWQKPRLIFVNSMSDLFHENVPEDVIDRIFAVMALATRHTFQVLTKRPERMRAYLQQAEMSIRDHIKYEPGAERVEWPLPNVWIGVSVENQDAADERIPVLLDTPAAVRWLSMEPLVGPVDLYRGGFSLLSAPANSVELRGSRIDWVVVGGESGPDARPMHPEWAFELRAQCEEYGVPFLFKQWGEWVPRSACYHTFEDGRSCGDMDPQCQRWPCIRLTYKGQDGRRLSSDTSGGSEAYMQRVGKRFAGRLLQGKLHDGYPLTT